MALSIFPQLLDWQFYGPTLLRLVLGAIFLAHGYQKLAGDSEGRAKFAGWLESMKFRPGKFWAWFVALVEFLGGVLLVIGLWTQLVALILAVQFLVILFWVQRGKPFISGWEFDFLILFALLALLVLGPGALAFDLPL